MEAPVRYCEELRSALGFYPTWPPSYPVELGSFGVLERGVFKRLGGLTDLKIVDVATRSRTIDQPFNQQSGMTFRTSVAAKADASLVDALCEVEITASRTYAWAFAVTGGALVEIDNIFEVEKAIVAAKKEDIWKSEYLLVTEVQHADLLNVVVARSSGAKVRVHVKGPVQASAVLLSTDASFESDESDIFRVTLAKQTTPLFGLRRLRGIINKGLRPIASGESAHANEELSLVRAQEEPMF
jgi:hypothetical protein